MKVPVVVPAFSCPRELALCLASLVGQSRLPDKVLVCDDGSRETTGPAGPENRFALTGRVGRDRIPDIFRDLDLSVSTDRNEGFGIVHIESFAGPAPVVAHDAGGYVEMLREGGGVVVEGGDGELASAALALLGSDRRREAFATEGRRIVEEKFPVSRMWEDHLRDYREIAAGGKR